MTEAELFTSVDTRCWERDGALILELHQPRPTVTTDVLTALERAVSEAERGFATLVVAAGSQHFAFGATLEAGFRGVLAGRPEVLDAELANYQRIMLRLRHATVPIIAAVRGVAISGGCELLMHCTRVVTHARCAIGLAEASVGVVPGGGGLKEFAYRAARSDDLAASITRAYATVTAATIARGGQQARELGFLTAQDVVDVEDPLAAAIELGKSLHAAGHVPPPAHPTFRVAGSQLRAQLEQRQAELLADGKITPHQCHINRCIANVLCGGNAPGDMRSEAELLALERANLVALAETPLTQARMAHLRATGQVLVN